jgi:hypothetical protein
MQCLKKKVLHLESSCKCYPVASVTETFTLEGVQTIHGSTCIVKLFLKRPALFR